MSLTRSRPPPSVHSSWVSPTSQSSASSMSQRSHSSPSLSPDFDYFAQNVLDPSFQRYASPSATPNPNTPGGGFHPYRRPTTLTKSRSSHAARASSPLVSTSLSRNPSPALPLPSKRPSTAPRPQVQERTRSNSSGSSQGSSSTPTASPVARGLSPQFEALRRLRRVPVVSDPASTPSTPVTEAATTAPPSEHTPDVSTSLSPPPSSPPTDPPKRPSRMAIFSKSKSEGKAADTISLSSTMSSASLMIRKLGKLGSKLPAMKGMRRESLSGISSIFSKTKKHAKSETLEPSVSYATVELDRTNDLKVDPDGLTPAARLAQEHLAKSQPIEIQLPPESVSSPRDSSYEPTILIQQPSPDVTENLKTNDTVAPVLSAVDDGRSQAYEDALIEAWSSLHLSPTPKPLTKGILKNRNGSSEQPSNVLAHSAPIRDSQNPGIALGHLSAMTSLSPDHVDGLQRRSSRSSRKSLPSKENVNPAGDPVTLMAVSKPSMKPKKQLSFAPTLMVYETFGHEEYDRTSEEPGTWKLLTPELARSIREELERFKMEEMLLHESYLNG